MKISFPYNSWPGGFLNSIMKSFKKLNYDVFMVGKYNPGITNKIIRNFFSGPIYEFSNRLRFNKYNEFTFNALKYFQPDLFFNISGSYLYPDTIRRIKEELKCTTICLVADNPFDPGPSRDRYFPTSLQYYDILLVSDMIWSNSIRLLSPKSKIIKFLGGYDEEYFYPITIEKVDRYDLHRFDCDAAFTGGSYGFSPEGAYRAGILGQLADFNVKIWGDKGWKYRFNDYPSLKSFYQGDRLSYADIRKLFSISTSYINMPSPQIFTSFQPRVFEIAASKGFQIIDFRTELTTIFNINKIAVFYNINDLKEKILFYKNNKNERLEIINYMYETVVDKYSWSNQIKILMDNL